jgi:predicted transcriptional regulator
MRRTKVQLHVERTADQMGRRFISAWRRAKRGKRVDEHHVSFESWDGMASVITEKRLEILRRLHLAPAKSVAALARALGRDYKRVHEDIALLEAAGLIERDESGLRADYDEIGTTVSLGA